MSRVEGCLSNFISPAILTSLRLSTTSRLLRQSLRTPSNSRHFLPPLSHLSAYRSRLSLSTMAALTLEQAITPSRAGVKPSAKKGAKGKGKKGDQEIILPDFVCPPAKNAQETRELLRMSQRMEGCTYPCLFINGETLSLNFTSFSVSFFPFLVFLPVLTRSFSLHASHHASL